MTVNILGSIKTLNYALSRSMKIIMEIPYARLKIKFHSFISFYGD